MAPCRQVWNSRCAIQVVEAYPNYAQKKKDDLISFATAKGSDLSGFREQLICYLFA